MRVEFTVPASLLAPGQEPADTISRIPQARHDHQVDSTRSLQRSIIWRFSHSSVNRHPDPDDERRYETILPSAAAWSASWADVSCTR